MITRIIWVLEGFWSIGTPISGGVPISFESKNRFFPQLVSPAKTDKEKISVVFAE